MSAQAEKKSENDWSGSSPSWVIRIVFAVAGIVLLGGAVVAWQYQSAFGSMANVLPWVVAAALILGAGAIIESISAVVWVALFTGIFAVAVAFVITGRFVVTQPDGRTIFVVDRFAGQVQFCSAEACRTISRGDLPPHH
jgi:hypothetical protein